MNPEKISSEKTLLIAKPKTDLSNTPDKTIRYVIYLTHQHKKQSSFTQTIIWNPIQPIGLGHPARWFCEKTKKGVRIRCVDSPLGVFQKNAFIEITAKDLEKKTKFDLPVIKNFNGSKYTISIHSAKKLNPVFNQSTQESKGTLKIYTCLGQWIKQVDSLQLQYVCKLESKKIFKIKEQDKKVILTGLQTLEYEFKGKRKNLDPKEVFEFDRKHFAEFSIRSGVHHWRLAPAEVTPVPSIDIAPGKRWDEESKLFKRSLQIAFGLLFLLTIAVNLKPGPVVDEEELIPPQFAKIVMTSPEKTPSTGIEMGGGSPAPTKATQTAVVQAFRAKAVQNAVQGLLKGGLTTLLAQSDLVSGNRKATKNIFNARQSMKKVAKNQLQSKRKIQIASIGGKSTGKQIGYGKGKIAAVAGQGTSFVSFDIGGSKVQQGLTKDEVGKVIHAHLNEVRYCYESAMVRSPNVEGKLTVSFNINPAGRVTTTAVKASSVPDARLDDCLLRRLKRWKFPKPKGGVNVGVTYPFIFKSLDR